MDSEFDPYSELLDIKSADRPPNHYALLGLKPFESDRDRIDEAAGSRMEMLQELSHGEYMDASQQLLNEVSAARRCLLDTTKKIAYDEDLRTRQRRGGSSPGKRSGPGQARQRRGQPVIPVGIALILVIILGVVWLLTGNGTVAPRNLIIDWPASERDGAVILLNGDPLEIPNSDPVNLDIPKGRQQLVFRREGYKDIQKTIKFENVTIRMKLNWVPKK